LRARMWPHTCRRFNMSSADRRGLATPATEHALL
jgi:hypothetical protein